MNGLVFVLLLWQIGYPGSPVPGQYPPGQYPPGQYPGGAGIPIPGRSKKTASSEDKNAATAQISGVVQKLDEKSMEVEAEDTRIITFQINDKTAKPKDLAVGYTVDVTAKDDGKGGFIADTIKVTKSAEAAKTAPASGSSSHSETASTDSTEPATTNLKGPKYDAGDDGPPVLKRGKPAQRSSRDTGDEVASAAPAPASEVEARPSLSRENPAPPITIDPRLTLIDQARDEAANFLEGLPNYVCQELATRYVSEGHVNDWHALDVVSMELVYSGGKEDYRNIQINGKATKKPVEETGAWSSGEFGSILADLFSYATAAHFKFVKDTTISGFPSALYDFTVDHDHSHWRVTVMAQTVFPSYKGSIWIDKKTGRVLRIEMQATKLPAQFPEDAVESAVDYNYVSLGSVEKFFLPVHAEILGCERGSNTCGRNVIEFRNYHKFTGESTVIFDK